MRQRRRKWFSAHAIYLPLRKTGKRQLEEIGRGAIQLATVPYRAWLLTKGRRHSRSRE
jgi:hypothetical protein